MITVKKFESGIKKGLPGGYIELKGINFEKLFEVISTKGEYIKSSDSYIYKNTKIFRHHNLDGSYVYGISIIGKDFNCYNDFVYITDEKKVEEIIDILEDILK